jgi:AcrR family transcriptional regulator
MSLRARHKRDKLERLRTAAWELFTTEGFERTTTRAIAERAGVAAGTVFLYAKDKRDLLFLVFEHRLAECVQTAFTTMPRDAALVPELMHVFRLLFAMYERNPDVARHFVYGLPGADGPNAERVNGLTLRFLEQMGGLVEEAQAKGQVRPDVEPLMAAQSVFALYYMSLLSWLSGFSTREAALDFVLEPSLELLMQGMRA